MSFDVNVFNQKPVIKAAANMQNDGGGGNLGYMSQGRNKNKKRYEEVNIFQQTTKDTFSMSGKYPIEDNSSDFSKFIDEVLEKLKELFRV